MATSLTMIDRQARTTKTWLGIARALKHSGVVD